MEHCYREFTDITRGKSVDIYTHIKSEYMKYNWSERGKARTKLIPRGCWSKLS